METKIAIYIPDDEAKKFLLFQQYYDVFSLMLEKGVFNQKKANIILTFDHDGVLQTIQRSDFMYTRKYDKGFPQV